MRSERFLCLLLLLALCLPGGLCFAEEEETDKGEILVIYPEEADRHTGPDSLSGIARVLTALRCTADYVEVASAAELPGAYDQVIWCACAHSDRMDASMLAGYGGKLLFLGCADGLEPFGVAKLADAEGDGKGTARYSFDDDVPFVSTAQLLSPGVMIEADSNAGELELGGRTVPLASSRGDLRYLALADYTSPFAEAVLMQEISAWLWPYEARMHTYTEYLVVDEIYPFTDPYRLRTLVEYMVAQRMTFVLSVMPIYEHAEYPAMQQFCEVLRFAQDNGGSVVLHAPLIQNGVEHDELAAKLTTAGVNYMKNGVYPLGLELPSEWLFMPELYDLLGRTRTLFLSDMDAFASHPVREYAMGAFFRLGSRQVAPALELETTGISHLGRCSSAVYLNYVELSDEQVYAVIDAVKDSPLPMQSLWDMDQAFYYNEGHVLLWDGGTLLFDSEQVSRTYEPQPYDSDFDYQRDMYYRFVTNMREENRFLIGFSAVVLVLFLFLGVRSRKQMHRRFFYQRRSDEDERTRV